MIEISIYFCMTVIMANLSFKYIETPFLNLKSRFK
jgi:peptidoglycan/LPS O-acetylase OafA/YrhL